MTFKCFFVLYFLSWLFVKISFLNDRFVVSCCFQSSVNALVTLCVQFYALIGQNLTGEFMRKIYAVSWKLFTLTAEADRVLCQLVMFLTVFSHWMYKMKNSCFQESSVTHGWFVYWVFGWEIRRLSKFGNLISDGIVFVFHL